MGKIFLGFLLLIRIPNCLIVFFSVVVGSVIAARSFIFRPSVFLGAVIALITLGGGNALNDYFDFEIDKLNRPKRPLPSGRITNHQALIFSVILFSSGLGLSFFLDIRALAIVALNILLLIVYAHQSKSMVFISNLVIGWLTCSVFLFAGVIQETLNLNILVLSLSAFFVMTSREILKDIEDMEGDRKLGAATLPIKTGARKARIIATLFILPALPLLFLPHILRQMNVFYLIFAVLAALAVVYSFFPRPEIAQKVIKIAIVLVLIAFLLGIL